MGHLKILRFGARRLRRFRQQKSNLQKNVSCDVTMPVLMEGSPAEEGGNESETVDLRDPVDEHSPKENNRNESSSKEPDQQTHSVLILEQPTLSDLKSCSDGNTCRSQEQTDRDETIDEWQDAVASTSGRSQSPVVEKGEVDSVPSQEFSERKARARELKEKMQVLVEVAHQKSASMSQSAASSKPGSPSASKLTSPATKKLRRQLNRYKDVPRTLAFEAAEDESKHKLDDKVDEEEITCDGLSVIGSTSTAKGEHIDTDILTSVSQLEAAAYPQLDDLVASYDDDASDQLSQELSIQFSYWTDAADSAAHHDPRCCDAFLVPNRSMLEYPIESPLSLQANTTFVSTRTEKRTTTSTSIRDFLSFIPPIHSLASMDV